MLAIVIKLEGSIGMPQLRVSGKNMPLRLGSKI